MKIIIDPGHGGTDTGAIGFGMFEKDLNMAFAKKLTSKLNAQGYETDSSLINDVNYSSVELTDLIKASGASLCLSCHNNAFNGKARGMEVIHSVHSDGKLASLILDHTAKTSFPIRKAYSRESSSFPGNDFYYVIRLTYPDVETIIIEFGFIDNADDFNMLTSPSWQDKLTAAVAAAVSEYIPIPHDNTDSEPADGHWAKTDNDELIKAGLLFSDHSLTLDNNATEGMVIALINRLRKKLLDND